MNLKRISKAIAGAFSGGLAALVTAAQGGEITSNEWITIALAFIGAGYVVWQAPANAPKHA